jgi:hypothetical protein
MNKQPMVELLALEVKDKALRASFFILNPFNAKIEGCLNASLHQSALSV